MGLLDEFKRLAHPYEDEEEDDYDEYDAPAPRAERQDRSDRSDRADRAAERGAERAVGQRRTVQARAHADVRIGQRSRDLLAVPPVDIE